MHRCSPHHTHSPHPSIAEAPLRRPSAVRLTRWSVGWLGPCMKAPRHHHRLDPPHHPDATSSHPVHRTLVYALMSSVPITRNDRWRTLSPRR